MIVAGKTHAAHKDKITTRQTQTALEERLYSYDDEE
jgi:hypothetical protein